MVALYKNWKTVCVGIGYRGDVYQMLHQYGILSIVN